MGTLKPHAAVIGTLAVDGSSLCYIWYSEEGTGWYWDWGRGLGLGGGWALLV